MYKHIVRTKETYNGLRESCGFYAATLFDLKLNSK